MTIYSDDFNRADSSDLGSNWKNHANGSPVVFQIISNQSASANPRYSGVWGCGYDSATCTGQMFAEITVGALQSSEDAHGPAVCMVVSSTVGHPGYYLDWSSGGVKVKKAGTTLATISTTIAVGDVVKLVASPDTPSSGTYRLQAFVNGTQIGSNVDDSSSPLTGQKIGMSATYPDYTARVNAWRGGDGDGATGTAPNITTTTLADGDVGTSYSQTLAATGTTPITWSVASGSLPGGLSLNTSTGVISGTPTTPGAFSFSIGATNGVSPNDTQSLSITVPNEAGGGGEIPASGTAPVVTTTSLAAGTVGTSYSRSVSATGDTPITWSIISGSLPGGLSQNTSTGTISGTPTAAGAFSFTVRATNDFGSDDQALSITVAEAAVAGASGGMLLAYPNLVVTSTLSGGDWGSTLDNILTRDLGECAVSASLDAADTQFVIDLQSTQAVRMVIIQAHNVSAAGGWQVDFGTTSGGGEAGTSGAIDAWRISFDDRMRRFPAQDSRCGYPFHLVYVHTEEVECRYIKISITDPDNDETEIRIGRAFVAPGVEVFMDIGATVDWVDPSDVERMRGGGIAYRQRRRYRVAEVPLSYQSATVRGQIMEARRGAGVHDELGWVSDTLDAAAQQEFGFVGRWRGLGQMPWSMPLRWSTKLELEELL